VQNSISRETVKGTRVSFFCADFTGVSRASTLPQFVKTSPFWDVDLACLKPAPPAAATLSGSPDRGSALHSDEDIAIAMNVTVAVAGWHRRVVGGRDGVDPPA
jgi:hypothetical protein